MRWVAGFMTMLAVGTPCLAQAPSPSRAAPVIETSEVMELFLEPMYAELKLALEKPPASRKEWAAIYRSAVKLAEVNNLLFFRSPGRYTDNPEWAAATAAARQAAADVATATFVALRNARVEDFEPVKARLAAVAESCNACHRAVKVDAKIIRP